MTAPLQHGTTTLSELEGVFPAGWRHDCDVLCVVGPATAAFYEALVLAGQARVVVLDSPTSRSVPPPEPYVRVASPLEVYQSVLRFQGEPPTNAAIRMLAGAQVGERELVDLAEALRGAVATTGIHRRSLELLAPQWARHGVANLGHLADHPSITGLRDAFSGQPCVIVSPGPSLDRNAHLLERLVGRAVVMTCSHALRAIEEHGARPDLVMVSDPKFTGRHFAGSESARSATLLLDVVVDPQNFELDAKRMFTFSSSDMVDAWTLRPLGDDAYIETGGSVACAEFSLAQFLGCDPIVLVGQDLALTDGRYYASTSIDGRAYVEVSEDGSSFELVRPHVREEQEELEVTRHPEEGVLTVRSWDGGEVRTSESLFTFLQWFRVAAQSCDRQLYNCTEGGAHIDGMEHCTLEEFLARTDLPELDVERVLAERGGAIDLEVRRSAMLAHVERLREGLSGCAARARSCGDLARRAARDARALDRLGEAEALLTEALGPLPVVSMFAQSEIREAQTAAVTATTLEGNLEAAQRLYGSVIAAVRELEGPLGVARERLVRGRS